MEKTLLLILLLLTSFEAKSQTASSKTDIKVLLSGDFADPSILKDIKN